MGKPLHAAWLSLVLALAFVLCSAEAALAIAPSLNVDVSAPENSANSGWFNVPVTLTFHDITWADPLFGGRYDIVAVDYTLDGSAPIDVVPTSTLSVSADGRYEVSAKGTWGGYAYPLRFGIDTSAPVSLCDAKSTYVATANVSIVASDPVSGPAYIRYWLDGRPGVTVTVAPAAPNTTVHAGVGAHTLSWSAVDAAGNAELPWHRVSFTVDSGISLGALHVSVRGRCVTVRGRVSGVRRRATVRVVFERWSDGRWVAAGCEYASLEPSACAWTVVRVLRHRGLYRVHALATSGGTSPYAWFRR